MKYKGHKNENLMIHAESSEDHEFIICGSEDNMCYIWNKEVEVLLKNKMFTWWDKNDFYEKFSPFAPDHSIPTCTFFLPLNALKNLV